MAKLQAETLTDKEMDLWSELITSFSSDHLGRAHEMLFSAIVELRQHRAMVKRLEEFAVSLETNSIPGRFIAAELRNRMRGA